MNAYQYVDSCVVVLFFFKEKLSCYSFMNVPGQEVYW